LKDGDMLKIVARIPRWKRAAKMFKKQRRTDPVCIHGFCWHQFHCRWWDYCKGRISTSSYTALSAFSTKYADGASL